MYLSLSQILSEIDAYAHTTERVALSASHKVMYVNWAQAEIQQYIESHVLDGAFLFTTTKTYTLSSTASYALPFNFKGMLYAEWSSDQTSWFKVTAGRVQDRVLQSGLTESDLYPDQGYLRLWFTRRLSPLFECLLSNSSASSTSMTFPAVPTYSATGAMDLHDDEYVGATVDTQSGTGAGQSSPISAYTGSTRTATVSLTSNVDSTTVVSLRCDLPDDSHQAIVYGALRHISPRDQDIIAAHERALELLTLGLHDRSRDQVLFGHGDDENYEQSAQITYFLQGNRIYLLEN